MGTRHAITTKPPLSAAEQQEQAMRNSFAQGLEQLLGGINTDVRKVAYQLIVVMVMRDVAFKPTQTQLSDNASEQEAVTSLQGPAAEIEAQLNSFLGTITEGTQTGTPTIEGTTKLLQQFSQMFYSTKVPGSTGSGTPAAGTWGDLVLYLPDGSTIPFMTDSGGTWSLSAQANALLGGANGVFSQVLNYIYGAQGTQWPNSPFYTNPSGHPPVTMNDIAYEKPPGILTYAFWKLQSELDKAYHLSADPNPVSPLKSITAADITQIMGAPSGDSTLSGANGLFSSFNTSDSSSGLNVITLIQGFNDGTLGQAAITGFMTILKDLGQIYYNNKFKTDSKANNAPTTAASAISDWISKSGLFGTLSQQQTQTLTAQIQKLIQDLQSFDKIAQQILNMVYNAIKTYTSNQKSA